MIRAAILILMMSATSAALAEPVPNRGGSCPHGYTASGGYCVPSHGASDAIPKPPSGNCPWGWLASGNACVRSGSCR